MNKYLADIVKLNKKMKRTSQLKKLEQTKLNYKIIIYS